MDNQQDELQSLKQKYYDAIGDLGTREKQSAEIEQVLRQGLNRISLAADDSDDQLNRQVEALRGEIRKGSPCEAIHEYGITLQQELRDSEYDAILIAVAHKQFNEMGSAALRRFAKPGAVLFDVKYLFPAEETDGRL